MVAQPLYPEEEGLEEEKGDMSKTALASSLEETYRRVWWLLLGGDEEKALDLATSALDEARRLWEALSAEVKRAE